MRYSIEDKLFWLVGFSLIFTHIPKLLQLNLLFSSYAAKASLYFLVALFCVVFYKQKKGTANYDIQTIYSGNYITRFLILYIAVTVLSLFLGLYMYPYYDAILNGPISQIEKLPRVLELLHAVHIHIDEKVLLIGWMLARIVKTFFVSIVLTFGVSWLVWIYAKKNPAKVYEVLKKATITAVVVIVLYGIIDIIALGNIQWAKEVLITINPLLHVIKLDGTWWPPLLWKAFQLRSVFAEPSFFGMYAAFAMPFLWYSYVSHTGSFKKKIGILLLIFLLSICVFLTNARTAVLLLGIDLVLYIILLLIVRRRKAIKQFLIILCCIVVGFVANLGADIYLHAIARQSNTPVEISLADANESYFENNVASMASTNKRSNNARLSILVTNIRIGMNYPVLGVGKDLRNAYVPDYLPAFSEGNAEVEMWKTNQQEKGILRAVFPGLGEYTMLFAETGSIGLILFLVPPMYLLYLLVKCVRKNDIDNEVQQRVFFFIISLLATMAAAVTDVINVFYSYWIMLGLGYALVGFTGKAKE